MITADGGFAEGVATLEDALATARTNLAVWQRSADDLYAEHVAALGRVGEYEVRVEQLKATLALLAVDA